MRQTMTSVSVFDIGISVEREEGSTSGSARVRRVLAGRVAIRAIGPVAQLVRAHA